MTVSLIPNRVGLARRTFAAALAFAVALSLTLLSAGTAGAAVHPDAHVHATAEHAQDGHSHASKIVQDCEDHRESRAAHDGACCKLSCHAVLLTALQQVGPAAFDTVPTIPRDARSIVSRLTFIDRPPRHRG